MLHPIYTEATECQDCYRCIRHCPVKAIDVKDGVARIAHDRCLFCGKCVEVCPVQVKKVRSDLDRAKQLLKIKERVYVSLAPSYGVEFGTDPQPLIRALGALGFAGVSSTAVGAREVSRGVAAHLASHPERRGWLSTACPVTVDLVEKYHPEMTDRLVPLESPMVTHGRMIKGLFGPSVGVVFIGPCLAKKREADLYSRDIDLALTFKELWAWFEEKGIVLGDFVDGDPAEFMGEDPLSAVCYPREGGMVHSITADFGPGDFQALSGVHNLETSLGDLTDPGAPIFVEALACSGGCINGPGISCTGGLLKKSRIIDRMAAGKEADAEVPSEVPGSAVKVMSPWGPRVSRPLVSDRELLEQLARLGKYRREDEKNCGGCGYGSCRDFALACLAGNAEACMCVTRMRMLAQQKVNALIRTIPLALVTVDENLRIVECNGRFLRIFGEIAFDPDEDLISRIAGRPISGFLDEPDLFQDMARGGYAILERQIRHRSRVFQVVLFPIEKPHLTGVVFQDITAPSMKKEVVVQKAEEVIRRSLESVQQIASLLGENAADTEMTLQAVIDAFDTPEE